MFLQCGFIAIFIIGHIKRFIYIVGRTNKYKMLNYLKTDQEEQKIGH